VNEYLLMAAVIELARPIVEAAVAWVFAQRGQAPPAPRPDPERSRRTKRWAELQSAIAWPARVSAQQAAEEAAMGRFANASWGLGVAVSALTETIEARLLGQALVSAIGVSPEFAADVLAAAEARFGGEEKEA